MKFLAWRNPEDLLCDLAEQIALVPPGVVLGDVVVTFLWRGQPLQSGSLAWALGALATDIPVCPLFTNTVCNADHVMVTADGRKK